MAVTPEWHPLNVTDWSWADPAEAGDLIAKVHSCERLLAVVDRFPQASEVKSVDDLSPPSVPPSALGAFEEFGRTTKTFRAVLSLATAGFGPQALMLAAVVYESAMTVIWAARNPDSADYYASLHARWLIDRYESTVSPLRHGDAPSSNSVPLSDEERQRALELFGPDGANLWTGHESVDQLVQDLQASAEDETEALQFQRLLEISYRWALYVSVPSGVAHQSQREQLKQFTSENVGATQIGPSTSHVAFALHLASRSYLAAGSTLAEKYFPSLEPEFERAGGHLFLLWKEPHVLAGLADDDPCPCDLPGASWATCHKWTLELSDRHYEPITDSHIGLRSISSEHPWEAAPEAADPSPPVREATPERAEPEHETSEPDGPVTFTFTCTLPFTLGVNDLSNMTLAVHGKYLDPDDIAHFGEKPWVRFRTTNVLTGGIDLWPANSNEALCRLYGEAPEKIALPKYGSENHYEQWITMETPSGRLDQESPDDPAYAFHRCFRALNTYLLALGLILKNSPIHGIATQDLGSILFRGYFDQAGSWHFQGTLLMHPERWPFILVPASLERRQSAVSATIRDMALGRPFIASSIWHGRATQAERHRGDHAAAIVYLQTAAETMVFDLWRSLLVDKGKTSSEIAHRIQKDMYFKTVLDSELPKLLGGSWDTTLISRPVGLYWAKVYEVRNRIVHGGIDVGPLQSSEAIQAFLAFREYISERLWARHTDYPRTLMAKVGENGLVRRGWSSPVIRQIAMDYRQTSIPFYWPRDIRAKREKAS
jgi:hypothetical protein